MATTSILAHRGASADAPENTMAAFHEALRQGADGIELDVTRCATGEVVVIHDATVDRTTDGTGEVRAMSLAELRALDASMGFEVAAGVPTLAEVLAALPPTLLDIELKPGGGDPLVQAVLELIADTAHRVVLTSFDADMLVRVRQLAPKVAVGLLLHGSLRGDRRLTPDVLGPDQALLDPAWVAARHRAGVAVYTWTVNTPEHITAALRAGVDALITDHPQLARRIREHGGWQEE